MWAVSDCLKLMDIFFASQFPHWQSLLWEHTEMWWAELNKFSQLKTLSRVAGLSSRVDRSLETTTEKVNHTLIVSWIFHVGSGYKESSVLFSCSGESSVDWALRRRNWKQRNYWSWNVELCKIYLMKVNLF